MYNTTGLIPVKFLTLIVHFTICVNLLWSSKESVKSCLPEMITEEAFNSHHTQLVTGLSVAIAMLCFEFLIFIFGITMFNSTSALLSIYGHASASILLCFFILDTWQCEWFWWIFSFGSVLPVLYDIGVVIDVFEISVTKPGWTKLLILAGISTTIGSSLPVGFHIGVVNTPADIIKSFCNESVYTRYDSILKTGSLNVLWSSIVSIFLVGGATGSLGGSLLADKVGRKGALIVSSILALVGGLLFLACKTANSVEMIFLGRLLVGLSSGLITSVMPMYLTELAPLHLRGATGVLCPLGVTCGVLLGQVMSMYNILGNETYWPSLLAFYLIPLLISSTAIPFLPESPKYLFVIKKQQQIALKQLCRIRNANIELLNEEIRELRLEEQDNSVNDGETWSLSQVLGSKELMLPLLLVVSLQAGQQFSGINAVFYYSSTIFTSAGLSRSSSELATIGAGCCNLFMAILSIQVMSNFNRRSVLQISLSSTAFFLILLGVATTYIDSFTWMPYVSVVGVLGFVICYGIALGPIPYFVGSELFEVGPRPSAMALGSMANWGGNFFVGLFFPLMQSSIGAASFFIFASIVVLLYIFTRIYLPETRGRDPSEIAHLCQNGFASKPLGSPVNSLATEETFQISDIKSA